MVHRDSSGGGGGVCGCLVWLKADKLTPKIGERTREDGKMKKAVERDIKVKKEDKSRKHDLKGL